MVLTLTPDLCVRFEIWPIAISHTNSGSAQTGHNRKTTLRQSIKDFHMDQHVLEWHGEYPPINRPLHYATCNLLLDLSQG